MRQHLPLAATTVQIQERIEYLVHIEFPGPASPTGARRWNQGLYDCPLGIRKIRRIRPPLFVLLRHPCALLCPLSLAPPFYHICYQNQFPESLLVLRLWDCEGCHSEERSDEESHPGRNTARFFASTTFRLRMTALSSTWTTYYSFSSDSHMPFEL